MNRLITFNFWFDIFPEPFTKWALIACLVILGLILAGAVYCFWRQSLPGLTNPVRKLIIKLGNWSLSLSLIGLALVFFKYQMVPYFGMRIWLPLWALICLVWGLFIVKYWLVEMPKVMMEIERKKSLNKYLP